MGEDVEYKAGFDAAFSWKGWGMVKKGTVVRHGLVRLIYQETGKIIEAHYKNDIVHGFYRLISGDGKHQIGYNKDGKRVGKWIRYDASNNECDRYDFGDL